MMKTVMMMMMNNAGNGASGMGIFADFGLPRSGQKDDNDDYDV